MDTSLATAMPTPPVGAAADWTIPQRWSDYSAVEHATWDLLYARQVQQLQDRAVPAFLNGLQQLDMGGHGVPDFERLSARLRKLTGWSVVAVPGLVPEEAFFEHLANRRFVAGRFIRTPTQLDYLQEPDVFHDVFGHVPLLADPVYADYMQAYGEGGRRATRIGSIAALARLYWYTVEFGLIRDGDRLKIFGAGIVSSNGESVYALDSTAPARLGFDLQRVLRTDYLIDDYQQNYFVIDSFEDLLKQTIETDFAPLYADIAERPTIPVGTVLPTDRLFHANAASAEGGRS